jgi:hypothetical protein
MGRPSIDPVLMILMLVSSRGAAARAFSNRNEISLRVPMRGFPPPAELIVTRSLQGGAMHIG